jgi:hypothetical protein
MCKVILITFWLLSGIFADFIIYYNEEEVRSKWKELWFIHVILMFIGVGYMVGLIVSMIEVMVKRHNNVKTTEYSERQAMNSLADKEFDK